MVSGGANPAQSDPGSSIPLYPNMHSLPVGLFWEGSFSHTGTQSSYLWPWPYETSTPYIDNRISRSGSPRTASSDPLFHPAGDEIFLVGGGHKTRSRQTARSSRHDRTHRL